MNMEQLYQRSLEISNKKRQDYTSSGTKFENFERSSSLAKWFAKDEHKSFAVLIGTKLARLGALLGNEKSPNFESIDDTFLDLVTYCALFAEYVSSQEKDDWK